MLKISLWQKIKLLMIVYALRVGIYALQKTVKEIPLNEYSKELLNEADYQMGLIGYYKLAVDPTGDKRYYLKGDDRVYRVDIKARPTWLKLSDETDDDMMAIYRHKNANR